MIETSMNTKPIDPPTVFNSEPINELLNFYAPSQQAIFMLFFLNIIIGLCSKYNDDKIINHKYVFNKTYIINNIEQKFWLNEYKTIDVHFSVIWHQFYNFILQLILVLLVLLYYTNHPTFTLYLENTYKFYPLFIWLITAFYFLTTYTRRFDNLFTKTEDDIRVHNYYENQQKQYRTFNNLFNTLLHFIISVINILIHLSTRLSLLLFIYYDFLHVSRPNLWLKILTGFHLAAPINANMTLSEINIIAGYTLIILLTLLYMYLAYSRSRLILLTFLSNVFPHLLAHIKFFLLPKITAQSNQSMLYTDYGVKILRGGLDQKLYVAREIKDPIPIPIKLNFCNFFLLWFLSLKKITEKYKNILIILLSFTGSIIYYISHKDHINTTLLMVIVPNFNKRVFSTLPNNEQIKILSNELMTRAAGFEYNARLLQVAQQQGGFIDVSTIEAHFKALKISLPFITELLPQEQSYTATAYVTEAESLYTELIQYII